MPPVSYEGFRVIQLDDRDTVRKMNTLAESDRRTAADC
jgi:hypothetical protein